MIRSVFICTGANWPQISGQIKDDSGKRIGKGRDFASNHSGGRLRPASERPFDTSIAELLRCVVVENGEAG
jgi:hypothetical protein